MRNTKKSLLKYNIYQSMFLTFFNDGDVERVALVHIYMEYRTKLHPVGDI